jgi:hypothetical protein
MVNRAWNASVQRRLFKNVQWYVIIWFHKSDTGSAFISIDYLKPWPAMHDIVQASGALFHALLMLDLLLRLQVSHVCLVSIAANLAR